MCNDDAKRVPKPKCVNIRKNKGWDEDDREANNTKWSNDPLKSNLKWSHITKERNDGRGNDPKLLRGGHSSYSQNIRQSEYKWWRVSKSSHTNSHQQTYSIKWPSDINIHILNDREYYTRPFYFSLFHFFLFFYFIIFIFIFIFILPYIQTGILRTQTKKPQRWGQKWINMLSNANVA